MTESQGVDNRLRELRLARGLTQAHLAEQAGISRPAVTAIEGGRTAPSVTAALALARILNTTVEEIFGQVPASIPQWAWTPPREEWRAWQAEIAGSPYLIPVEAAASAAVAHDVVVHSPEFAKYDWEVARSTLVVASCDPAANLMASEYQALTGHRMIVVRRSSRGALELLERGRIHVAGMHLATHGRGPSNSDVARELLGTGFEFFRAASWKAGITTDGRFDGQAMTRLAKQGIRWVGREPGSGARQCLDEVLGSGRLYRHVARDHAGVIEAIRSGWADAGACVELASAEAGLPFRSVRTEDYDICFAAGSADDPRIRGLVELLQTRRYRKLLGELPGYQSAGVGASQSI